MAWPADRLRCWYAADSRKDAMTDPLLDSRRFQDLLDQARRLADQRAWAAAGPLSERARQAVLQATAMVVDQLIHRVNQLPGRLHRSLLDLVGIQRRPPTAATAPVTFRLTEPLRDTVVIPRGVEVSDESSNVVFTTVRRLELVPVELVACAVRWASAPGPSDMTAVLFGEQGFGAFPPSVTAGSQLLLGLSAPAPGCLVSLAFVCVETGGVGGDPNDPPLVWEAWTGDDWSRCGVDRDDTGGLDFGGVIVLDLPAGHVTSTVVGRRAAWLRCRLVEPEPGLATFTISPKIKSITAATVGGTTDAVHGRLVEDEPLGVSEGTPGQRFVLRHRPVAMNHEPPVIEVDEDGWQPWRVVPTFAHSGPFDRHVVVDAVSGHVMFGPMIREPDGTARMYGACPPADALVRVRHYWTGGGAEGNVPVGALSVLRTELFGMPPHRIENREPGIGGYDGESEDQVRVRAPHDFKARDRAVTAQDFEQLSREAAPELARVHCAVQEDGGIRVLLVPSVAREESGRIAFDQLVIVQDTVDRIASFLDERRVLGTRVIVEPVSYQGFTVVCEVISRPLADRGEVNRLALAALYRYFDPLAGGRDGTGWPFGRPVGIGDVHAILDQVPGVEYVDNVLLFPANAMTRERFDATSRIAVDRYALLFGIEHQIRVRD
ncbi:putative baseplate assembly protein [Actinocrispum wychmicini]|nr:putative baseplate assembly protein [Actinocrispum wychmicini]